MAHASLRRRGIVRCSAVPAGRNWYASNPLLRSTSQESHGPVRLHDDPRGEDRSPEAADPQEHLALVPSGREDRAAGPERRGKIHAAQDHGGHRQGLRGRCDADARHPHRLPSAGAAARAGTHGARGGRGGAGRGVRREEAPRRGVRRLRGARCRPRQARRGAGEAREDPRHCRFVDARYAARDRGRRAAPAAVGREGRRALRRREAPRRALPPAPLQAGHAAPRRADEPPRCGERGVARAVPRALSGDRRRGDARPLLPRQRRGMDPRARSRLGHSVQGQLQRVARAEARPAAEGGIERDRAPESDQEGARVGAQDRQGPADQEHRAAQALRGAQRLRVPEAQRDGGDLHSRGRAPGQRGDRVRERVEGVRRSPPHRQPVVEGAARGDRRHHRAQRRGQVDPLPHDHRQGEARFRRGEDRPDGAALRSWTRAAKLPDKKNVWEAVSGGQDIVAVGKFEIRRAPTSAASTSGGSDQQKLVGNLSGGERGRLHLAKTLLAGGNVLLLDEPSNDLDVETLRALEDALQEFAGTVAGDLPRSLVPRPHLPPTSSRPRATRSGTSSRETTASTRKTSWSGWARRRRSRTACASSR